MKRITTLLSMVFSLVVVTAQPHYKVGVNEEKKGLILEEFTGLNCSYCPYGHRMAEEIQSGYGERLCVVNLHAGPFSPKIKGMDLTTEDGDSLAYYFTPTSFPCGMINRHAFKTNVYLNDREAWYNLIKKIKDDKAPLNIYVESFYDDSNRQLKVHIEGFNVSDNRDADMRLHVLLMQDYMKGRQLGVADPYSYVHMNVLRDYITPFRGDTITDKSKGEYFAKDYVYDVPDSINGQSVEPGYTNVVAFVTADGMKEIVNARQVKPVFLNMMTDAEAKMEQPEIKVNGSYGFKFFESRIRNMCNERIENATFQISVNGKWQEVVADCNIDPFKTGAVKIPCNYDFDDRGFVDYEILLTAINGRSVGITSIDGHFSRPVCTDENVRVKILTDRSADENVYSLKDEYGSVLREFGPYETNKVKEYDEDLVLEAGKTYCVEVYDRFGNGVSKGRKGSMTICNGRGEVIDDINPIYDFGARSFFTVDKSMGIDDITIDEVMGDKAFLINGIETDLSDKGKNIIIIKGRKYLNK